MTREDYYYVRVLLITRITRTDGVFSLIHNEKDIFIIKDYVIKFVRFITNLNLKFITAEIGWVLQY